MSYLMGSINISTRISSPNSNVNVEFQVSRARMPRDAAGRPASVVKPQITKEIETAELRAFREQASFRLVSQA